MTVHALAPPVGLVEVSTSPAPSTATHSDAEGHETPPSMLLPSTLLTVHALAPPVGSIEVTAFPAPSTTTHSKADGHET